MAKTNNIYNNICFSKRKQDKQWSDRTQYVHTQRLFSKIVDNGDDPNNKDGLRNDIVLLSFDGTVAETSTWRSNMAIDVAYSIWPNEMNTDGMQSYQLDDPNTDRSWIINKIKALMQHLLSDQNGMTNCDAVLLVRLLMEEQLLDQGRSVGKTGKYASKFHPKSISDIDDFPSKGIGSNQGSRPLTVGEIAANWNNGACLRETVRVKYNVNRKDPIPIINKRIIEFMEMQEYTCILPIVHENIFKWMEQCRKTLFFVMVGHESHLQVAKKSLEQTSISIEIISVDEVQNILGQLKKSTNENDGRIFLIAPGNGDRGHVGILQQIIMSANSNEATYVQFIHPIVETLKTSRVLYGDNRYVNNSHCRQFV